ncbi:DegT/DnrJ/EryC1/StrS family aminotransferase [Lutibacter sp.]
MIHVTKTYLPPLKEYDHYIKRIWKKKWLTNRGDLVLELESKLKTRLGVTNILATTNGTIPLQIALKLFGKGGEIITTPFSYIATSAAIVWEHCTPVFVDIHPEYLCIDETKIEASITSKTTTILATHVFGNPCNVEVIEKIAKKYNLYVIYDAAHCFDIMYKGKSIFNYGDISTCSFHATKLFHTGEGGALFCKDTALAQKAFYSHNFGHKDLLSFHGLGINGKMSELQAAMGLAVLPYMEEIISSRKQVVSYYDTHLDFSNLKKIKIRKNTQWNYSYYPVIFDSEKTLLNVEKALNTAGIFPRRYFYPSLNTLPFLKGKKMSISEKISKTILCLPLYADLELFNIHNIVTLINNEIC